MTTDDTPHAFDAECRCRICGTRRVQNLLSALRGVNERDDATWSEDILGAVGVRPVVEVTKPRW